jgi:hypothetical protein
MPPWHADSAHGKFLNERRLSQAEIDTLADWAKTGAKEGNPQDAAAPRKFADGWTIGTPDLVLDMGTEYKVPAKGTIEYTYFVVPTGFTEDKWIEKVEVRPSARQVTHHIVVEARPPGLNFMKQVKPGEAFVPSKSPRKQRPDTGEGVLEGLGDGIEVIAVYVPGGDAYVTRPGQARLVKAGTDLIFQMHYTTNGTEATDRSRVGIIFAKEPPRERVINSFVSNRNLHIPAGEANCRVEARTTLYRDAKVQSYFPHMHVRGKAMEYRAIYPTGESQVLLSVPHYDFNWQTTYELAEPVLLPKGTRLEVSAWYDNSANNPWNPDPKSDVYWGDQTWEEMLAAFVDFVLPIDASPSEIVRRPKIDSSSN